MAPILSHAVGPRPQPHAYDRSMRGAQRLRATRTATIAVAAAAVLAAAWPAAAPAAAKRQRDVLVVSNNWAGTADVVDPRTLRRLGAHQRRPGQGAAHRRDPGRPRAQAASSTASASWSARATTSSSTTCSRSRDGRVRLRLAAELRRRRRDRPRAPADRLALPGRRLPRRPHGALARRPPAARLRLDRASVIDVIDTRAAGSSAASRPATSPTRATSRGTARRSSTRASAPSTRPPTTRRRTPRKGERVFEVIDARTLKVLKTIDMGQKLADARPPGHERRRPADGDGARRALRLLPVSFFLTASSSTTSARRSRRASRYLPLAGRRSGPAAPGQYLLDSAHHGLAINRAGTKLCVGRHDVGLRGDRGPRTLVAAAARPASAACPTGRRRARDGRYCFVSVAGDDRVSVISFRTAREVARIRVGDHPQRMRTGTVRAGLL